IKGITNLIICDNLWEMATNNISETGLDSHKRKIFIQKLGADTTKWSLKDYFSKYPIEWCDVPIDELGKNKRHGIVMFHSKESVDAVMSQRYHQIDGKEVFIHRSVPNQGPLKDNIEIQRLIVSSPNNQSLVESDIHSYFSQYGKISDITHTKNGDNTWVIHFD
ncbi:unnamed protein product, partial [Rotaria sp. Silwood1]